MTRRSVTHLRGLHCVDGDGGCRRFGRRQGPPSVIGDDVRISEGGLEESSGEGSRPKKSKLYIREFEMFENESMYVAGIGCMVLLSILMMKMIRGINITTVFSHSQTVGYGASTLRLNGASTSLFATFGFFFSSC
ncbi:hypothetical protein K1719_020329 [Acacia pycnantha]|nr:hypothetical protein K1719_020329 [Acacia pycnantha]